MSNGGRTLDAPPRPDNERRAEIAQRLPDDVGPPRVSPPLHGPQMRTVQVAGPRARSRGVRSRESCAGRWPELAALAVVATATAVPSLVPSRLVFPAPAPRIALETAVALASSFALVVVG